jgi:hypothetical protein
LDVTTQYIGKSQQTGSTGGLPHLMDSSNILQLVEHTAHLQASRGWQAGCG